MKLPLVNSKNADLQGLISIWGEFGVGKTILCFQIALKLASESQNVLYIYTKPNFPINRINELILSHNTTALNNLEFIECLNFEELYEFIFSLEFEFLKHLNTNHPSLNVIVIDSLTDLYQISIATERKAKSVLINYKLNLILANLAYLCEHYESIAIVVNNSKISSQDQQFKEIQAGGKLMNYWVDHSLKISRSEIINLRYFTLFSREKNKEINFTSKITPKGFI
jgi:RecA/RadA recombinase